MDAMTRRKFLARTALAAGGTSGLLGSKGRALAAAGGRAGPIGDLSARTNSHDLRLPRWGSYTTPRPTTASPTSPTRSAGCALI
jgi:hypothetical protein